MTVVKGNKPAGYSVRAACKKLGIGAHTLRAWENRYQAVEPHRSASGQRLYSQKEIDRLGKILGLVNLGHNVGVVAKLTDKELDKLLHGAFKPLEGTGQFERFLEQLNSGLARFDLHLVSSLLDQRRSSLGSREFVLQILASLMRWIGEMVSRETLSIAHEHALSAVVRDQIYQTLRYGAQPVFTKGAPHFVLATPEDDLHEFGILMASALLSHHGLPAHLLGCNLPVEALAIAVKAVGGNIVLLGNAPVPPEERKISFEAYLRELHKILPAKVEIWIGGAGDIPHLRSVMPGRQHRHITSLHEFDSLVEKHAAKGR